MTGPTREEVLQWARSIEGVRVFDMGGSIFGKPEYLERFAALAFAAGARSSSAAGEELVREIEEAAARIANMPVDSLNNDVRDWIAEEMCSEPFWWPRIRSALIAGDADTNRLEWIQFHGARVSWGNDDEMCCVVWSDRDGEQYRTALHSDWRAAIDEARGTRT